MSFVFSIIKHQYKILTAPERQHTSLRSLSPSGHVCTYQSSLETYNFTAGRTLVIKLREGLTTHLQGLVSAGPRFTGSKLGYQETRYGLVNIPKSETHKHSHKKNILVCLVWQEAVMAMMVEKQGKDCGLKWRNILRFELVWMWPSNPHLHNTLLCTRDTHPEIKTRKNKATMV